MGVSSHRHVGLFLSMKVSNTSSTVCQELSMTVCDQRRFQVYSMCGFGPDATRWIGTLVPVFTVLKALCTCLIQQLVCVWAWEYLTTPTASLHESGMTPPEAVVRRMQDTKSGS